MKPIPTIEQRLKKVELEVTAFHIWANEMGENFTGLLKDMDKGLVFDGEKIIVKDTLYSISDLRGLAQAYKTPSIMPSHQSELYKVIDGFIDWLQSREK